MAHSTTSAATSFSLDEYYLSDIITGAHGDKYQKDLALVMFQRAARRGYDFRLGYEMAIADKFDDVAFFDKIKNQWMLIQTKHADTSKGKALLKFDMLFPQDEGTREKGDFSLYKYLKSYVTVQASIRERKNVIIFTNRDMADFQNQIVEVEPRPVDDILNFEPVEPVKMEPRQIGFKVNYYILKEMVDYVNRDFQSLKDGIVKLFKEGVMNQAVKNYKTPVASILVESHNTVKFSENPSPEAYQMLESLHNVIDIKTAEVSLEKCKDIFTGQSRNKTWPLYTNVNAAHQFFQDLILFVSQPDDLSNIIDQDMRSWMRTWIRPDLFTRLEESQLKIVGNLEDFFNKKQSPSETSGVRTSYKKFLQLSDYEEFFKIAKNNLEKQIRNLSNYNDNHVNEFYVSRQIEYMELSDDKHRNDSGSMKMRIRDDDFVSQLYGKFNKQPFLLLTAEPGMGKSTILEHIAMAAQRKGITDFVYLFNLNTFNKNIKTQTETNTTDELLLILETMLSKDNFDYLQKSMQDTNYHKNVLIVFDAFDELFPHNREKVLKMLKQLLTAPNVKIIVSARRNVKTSLEDTFKVKTMSLVPFDEQDRKNFLKQFWNVPEENDSSLHEYIANLFKAFQSGINQALSEFIGIPLMLRMLAEVYAEHFSKFLKLVKVNLKELLPQEKYNVIILYEKFLRKCFNSRMVKKIDSVYLDNDEDIEELFKKFTLEHQLLGIKLLQIKVSENVLHDEKYCEIFNKFNNRLIQGTEKSPIIEVFDNDIKFIHLSYAEFLVATFLCNNINNYEVDIFAEHSQAKLFTQYPMIRIFFFAIIEEQFETKHLDILQTHYRKNSDIALWACEVYGLKIVEYLLRNIYDSTVFNRLLNVAVKHNCLSICTYLLQNHQVEVDWKIKGKTPLYIAAAKGYLEVVKMLIDKSADIEAKDDYSRTPLHRAAGSGHLEVVKLLIDKSADIEAKTNDNATFLDFSLIFPFEEKERFGMRPLHYAAESGHLEMVKLLIVKSADFEAKDNDDMTPLHYAAERGHLEVVKMLIEKSADIETKGKDGKTPLHCAAESGHLEMVKLLIDKSADIETKDNIGKTPLHYAAGSGHLEVVKMLIDKSADIEAKGTFFGKTPLLYAAEKGHLEVVKSLIDKSADIEAKDKYGTTLIHFAAKSGLLEVVKMLIDKSADIETKNNVGKTPLHHAAGCGHLEVVKMLIDKSADIEAKDNIGKTPLHYAAGSGHLEVVKMLIDKSADIEAKDKYGRTPLHHAAGSGHLEVVKMLIDKSADIEAKDKYGRTPLHHAAGSGHLEVVKMLIDKSADIEAKDEIGKTPLHYAAGSGHLEVVKMLIDKSADIEAKDKCGTTLIHCAAEGGLLEVVKMLIDKSADIETKNNVGKTLLHYAAGSGHLEVVKLLIDKSADIKAKALFGKTPLHYAAKRGRLEVVKMLIDKSADIEAKTNDGRTPLHFAAFMGHLEVVKMLIDKSADVEAKDTRYGRTPLHYAAGSNHLEVVKMLIEKSADIEAKDKYGKTPLQLASGWCRSEVVKSLNGLAVDSSLSADIV